LSKTTATTVQATGNGGWTTQSTTTGPLGGVWTTTGGGQVTPGTGVSAQSVTTAPNGAQATRNVWVTAE
jgi:hypothetical protein